MSAKIIYRIGDKIGECVFLEEIESKMDRKMQPIRMAIFECKCGNVFKAMIAGVKQGKTKSCGCYMLQRIRQANTTHGLRLSSEYPIWCTMLARCNNPNYKKYSDYGGRGIKVCSEWNNSFENFYKDMGARPSNMHSIERINNDLGYSKENCKWATKKEQARNTRSNFNITYMGQTKVLQEWADDLGVNREMISQRIKKYGWSIEDALTTPSKKNTIPKN